MEELVRLTANFPNVIYILAFDRVRVEAALAEQGIPGRDYIEKILQVGIDIPAVPSDLLNKQILNAIDKAISTIDNKGPFDESAWPDVFMEVIRPLVRNMRDVRRYAATIHGTVRDLDGQVALVDTLALEAIRIFLPDVFREMHGALAALTTSSDSLHGRLDAAPLKQQIERLISVAGSRADVIRALVARLFPAAQWHLGNMHFGSQWKVSWRRERRVPHEDILRLYLERIVGEGLRTFTDAERAWGLIADSSAFDSYLRSLGSDRLQDVIASLEVYESDFAAQHVVPGVVVLLNLLPNLPERRRGMFDLRADMVVGRVVYRLLRSLKDPDAIEATVREILPQLTTLYSRSKLIDIIGHREGVGQKLVSENAARSFEVDWRGQLRAAPPDALVAEQGLLWMLLRAKRQPDSAEPSLAIIESPQMTLAVLKSSRTEVLGQAMGSRAVQSSAHLAWEQLIELYGDEGVLRDRIEKLKAAQLSGNRELFQIVDKYVSGWRPNDFGGA